jgi:hypothetical protein
MSEFATVRQLAAHEPDVDTAGCHECAHPGPLRPVEASPGGDSTIMVCQNPQACVDRQAGTIRHYGRLTRRRFPG